MSRRVQPLPRSRSVGGYDKVVSAFCLAPAFPLVTCALLCSALQ